MKEKGDDILLTQLVSLLKSDLWVSQGNNFDCKHGREHKIATVTMQCTGLMVKFTYL